MKRTGADLKRRLERGAALLELIDRKRAESGQSALGAAVERSILDRELTELAADRKPEEESEEGSDMPGWVTETDERRR